MNARQSARIHLPEVARDWPTWESTFAASIETLTTPDGSWGSDPTADWPRLAAFPLPAPWPAKSDRVKPQTPRRLKP